MVRRVGWPSGSWGLIACAALLGCEAPTPHTSASRLDPIVGGRPEPGHAAVGAMVQVDGARYRGTFCTGTLIAPRWVLTAGHCFNAFRNPDGTVNAAPVAFYVGPDARGVANGGPPAAGSVHPAEAVHVHPGFRPDAIVPFHDLALVRLAAPGPDVPPYAVAGDGEGAAAGDRLLFVGYGVDDGPNRTGGGPKRATDIPIGLALESLYRVDVDEGGTCFGDSGGPSLRLVGEQWKVLGVNSFVLGEPLCLAYGVQSRPDADRAWIATHVDGAPTCEADPAVCPCPEACNAGAWCDLAACRPREGCRVLVDCLSRCGDPICALPCFDAAKATARRGYESLRACAVAQCEGADDLDACMRQRCAEPLDACVSDIRHGDVDCGATVECIGACRDRPCAFDCYEAASRDAQRAYDTLDACARTACGDPAPDPAAHARCTHERCADDWRGCYPPDDCRLTGGDCGADTACVPAPWGDTYCQASAGEGVGAGCDRARVSCADGATCLAVDEGPRCLVACTVDEDCPPRQTCALDPDAPIPFGGCTGCLDRDLDGACANVDCDDGDATARPGAPELCGDEVDQDCDGADDVCVGADGGARDATAPDAEDGRDAAPLDRDVGPPGGRDGEAERDGGRPADGAVALLDGAPAPEAGAEPDAVAHADGGARDAAGSIDGARRRDGEAADAIVGADADGRGDGALDATPGAGGAKDAAGRDAEWPPEASTTPDARPPVTDGAAASARGGDSGCASAPGPGAGWAALLLFGLCSRWRDLRRRGPDRGPNRAPRAEHAPRGAGRPRRARAAVGPGAWAVRRLEDVEGDK